MKNSDQATVQQDAPQVLSPLPDALNLLKDADAGCCGGGMCSVTPPAKD